MALTGGRQAVVIIHGIGEQVPMETLRGLIGGLGFTPFYSRPDRLSDSDELRRLTLPTSHGKRPRTDFFELYWAHHAEEGRPREVLAWAFRLLKRRSAWRGTRLALTLNVITVIFWFAIAALVLVFSIPRWRTELFTCLDAPPLWAALVAPVVAGAAGLYLARYIADAARYLTPRPANINARAAIRRQGVSLLRGLHESGDYKRVVVVGHSLGSVIGYDILRQYWDEARWPDVSRSGPQPEAEAFAQAVRDLPANPTETELDQFQQAQHRLWREQRSRGVRWLVTDFITLGSPLANAPMLLDRKSNTVRQMLQDRELPACPPVGAEGSPGFYRRNLTGEPGPDGQETIRSFYIADSGAAFASTRWTNLFFPVRGVIFGDLVGGVIGPVFGRGVWDIAVHHTPVTRSWKSWFAPVFPGPHVSYWRRHGPAPTSRVERRGLNRKLGTKESLHTLRHHLGLDIEQTTEPYPPAEPVQIRRHWELTGEYGTDAQQN